MVWLQKWHKWLIIGGAVAVVGIVLGIIIFKKKTVEVVNAQCQIDKLSYDKANNLCQSTEGNPNFSYVSEWRRNGYALIITDNKSIADIETSGVDIKTVVGEVDTTVISPTLMLAKIDATQAKKLKGKFHITDITFDKVDLTKVTDESDKDWLSVWNSDDKQLISCDCGVSKTWSCDKGCMKQDKVTCQNGGGSWQWWNGACRCPQGYVWYRDWGRCDQITVEGMIKSTRGID